jgi:serine/threonine-protein kinase
VAPAGIGDLIAGKYRIASVLGEGGMGTVFAARHELLDVQVAVKLLWPALAQDASLVDRFLREARAVARLRSEHVAHVMDVGTLPNGQPYIVMEHLEGEDLEQRLRRVGRLSVEEAVDCVLQALEAVAHAHSAGIVHRDLKPENLFVAGTPDGREIVKVLDFGIAKLCDATQRQSDARPGVLTAEHTTLGSPHYMAPEQVRDSRQVDHRADIWALGAILYELVTGEKAFPGVSVGEIFGAVTHGALTQARAFRPDAPAQLDTAIMRCLTRPVDARFADVADLAYALAPMGSGAWSGYAERIEQTLVRSQRLSDPVSGPISVRRLRPRASSIPEPLGVLSPTGASAKPSIPDIQGRGRGALWTLALVDLAFMAAISGLAIGRLQPHLRVDSVAVREASTAVGAPPPPPAFSAESLALLPVPQASPSAGLPQEAEPPDRALPNAGHQSRSAPARSAPPATKPARPTSKHLPAVLGSPD